MTDSTENATSSKSTKSRYSNSSATIQIESKSQFQIVPRDTENSECLDLADFGDVAFSVEMIIHSKDSHSVQLCIRFLHNKFSRALTFEDFFQILEDEVVGIQRESEKVRILKSQLLVILYGICSSKLTFENFDQSIVAITKTVAPTSPRMTPPPLSWTPYTCVYIYVCTYVYIYICINVYMYICIYVYIYTCTYMYMHIYIYICTVYLYIYICSCMYIHICVQYTYVHTYT